MRITYLLIGLIIFLLIQTPSFAERTVSGSISGRFVIKQGEPVPNGAVFFYNVNSGTPPAPQKYWKIPEHECYFAGDGARRDEDGYLWVMGRVDDVINVSGHRLSTMEVESALVSHEMVAEAAVVGFPHDLKGEGICCFVTLKDGSGDDDLVKVLVQHVREQIGALATPDKIRFAAGLPKTRSGKIRRRLLRDIASGKETVGDTSTLEDYSVLAKLRQDDES